MRALLIAPTHNAAGKRDVSGAFVPEARAFRDHLVAKRGATVHLVQFDNRASKSARRSEVERLIWETGGDGLWDVVALFCHGLKTSLQTGHDLATADRLAEVIALRSSDTVIVPLYACDAADTRVKDGPGGDGGMADVLRDALSSRAKLGHIDAHVTTGHTTRNPNVRRFAKDGRGPLTGGHYIVEPSAPKDATAAEKAAVRALWRRWVAALKGDLRFRFPLLTQEQIHAELRALAA